LKQLIVIAGPTASGKTAFALQLAQQLNCPIISADSRQVYKELNIGVARPKLHELNQAMHYFVASHSIFAPINAGQYEKDVLNLLDSLFKKHTQIILSGGTGLYIKAVTKGLDNLPDSSQELRLELETLFKNKGIQALQSKLKSIDPEFFKEAEIFNPQRLIRSIEIAQLSGKSNLEFRNKKSIFRDFKSLCFRISMPREDLYHRINHRVDDMIENGLESETRGLYAFKELDVLKTVGYLEFFSYFEGVLSFSECVALIKQNTRRYAKRQETWFKNQGDFEPIANIKQVLQKLL
jgi:tRNA dimethylallyltransferase